MPLIRHLRPALPAAAALLLAGCLATTAVPDRKLSESPEVLARIEQARSAPVLRGRAISGGPLMQELPQVEDPAIQREVDRILARVASVREVSHVQRPQAIVLASTGYHAEVNLEGQIAVSLGLLAKAGTEDEIAFVLGHELSHRLLGHLSERRASLLRSRQAVSLGSSAAIYAVGFSAQRPGGASPTVAQASTVSILTAVPALHALSVEVADSGYARGQEVEADRLGFDLLVRAGYSPGAVGSVFTHLEQDEQAREARLANLRGAMTNVGTVAARIGVGQIRTQYGDLGELFGGAAGTALGAVMERALQPVAQSYDPLPARRSAHDAYEEKHFNDVDVPTRPNPFRAGRLGAAVTERMEVLRRLDEAEGLMRAGRLDEAARLLDTPAMRRYGGARLHVAQATLALARGDDAGAARAIEAARRAPDATAMTYISLAAMQEKRGSLPGALAMLREGEQRFGAPEPFLPHRARIQRAMNDETGLRQTLAQCSATGIGALDRACADAARPRTG
jgi:predicted Zn-dependent protease